MEPARPSPAALAAALEDARATLLELVADLDGDRLIGPNLAIVNPPLWEIGHVAWFQEWWVLRHLRGGKPIREDADGLYDSSAVAHDLRYVLALPPLDEALGYMRAVLERVLERLAGARELDDDEAYFHQLALFHEDMHAEAVCYTRQTLAYPQPRWLAPRTAGDDAEAGPLGGDVVVPGATFLMGSLPGPAFAFDNELDAHPVEVAPFRMARAPVTDVELAAFVDDGGYTRRELWSDAGWAWRERAGAATPAYWRKEPGGGWLRRVFDRWLPLAQHRPALHVSWHEAEAYCRWARRRLPSEAEWEAAARAAPAQRTYPWGEQRPAPARANLDGRAGGPVDVAACTAGDSAAGCRQLLGNVWEWTADDFRPYPGFAPGPYRDYSQPWFDTHKVLRGGCWFTRARLIRNAYRNFYTPDRRDVWAGFRTCAL